MKTNRDQQKQPLLSDEDKKQEKIAISENTPVRIALQEALKEYARLRDAVWEDQDLDAKRMNNEDIGLFAIGETVRRKFTGFFGIQKDKNYAEKINEANDLKVLEIAEEILKLSGNDRLKFLVADAIRIPLGIDDGYKAECDTKRFQTDTYRQLGFYIRINQGPILRMEDQVLEQIKTQKSEMKKAGRVTNESGYQPPTLGSTEAKPSAPEQELPKRKM